MKKGLKNSKLIILGMAIILFIFYNNSIIAQTSDLKIETKDNSSIFLGVGLGINDYGFGACFEVPIVEKLSFYGNLGIGGWGYRYGAGVSFYPSINLFKSSISIGYTHASGLKGFETELEVEAEPIDYRKNVKINLNPISTINLVYAYNFHLGKKSKFAISTGYSIQLTENAYEIKTEGAILTDVSEQVLKILQPGGVILGFKFIFGLN